MAVPSSIVALDIGSHTIKLGEFVSARDGSLTLQRFSSVPVGIDPNKDDGRNAAVTQAVHQALYVAGLKGGKVHFSVAGHSVFLRAVKLPPVDAMQLDQMLAFEAQQIVPFPLAEVVWDFLILPGEGAEKEAIIVAIKSDLLEAEYAMVKDAGVDPVGIDVGPLALYNAYRYNYPQAAHCVLLIDIGARSTNLLFIEGDRLYTRILPLAGNTISQAVSTEFQEPFAVSDELKVQRLGVHLGGNYPLPEDPVEARLWKLGRTVATRIQTEINRSLIFYRNQQGGTSPQQILLTGGSSRLPYLDVFLSQKFGIPVEFFNPFQNVSLPATVDRDALALAAHGMGEVVGLAVRAAGPAPAEIHLEPVSISQAKLNRSQSPWVYAALGAWVLLFALLSFALVREQSAAEAATASLQAQTASLGAVKQRMAPLIEQNDALKNKFEQARKIIVQRDAWIRMLDDIEGKVPQGLWITQLTPTYNGQALDAEVHATTPGGGGRPAPGGKAPSGASSQIGAPEINQLQVKGLFENGQQPEIVNRFVTALADLKWLAIDPAKTSASIVSTDTPQAGDQQAWNYTLSLKLKQPLSLAP
jgi:type IV pilus assembly protein PilM